MVSCFHSELPEGGFVRKLLIKKFVLSKIVKDCVGTNVDPVEWIDV